ncbi:MAG: DUF5677 domain-containing protein [Acidobacteria bacterium]|nr:DUF5677 domain-containing protein [Acidobacteriota bacterium]
MEPVDEKWATLTQSLPEFAELFHAAFQCIPQIVLETPPAEDDHVGTLLIELMMASMRDLDDIMLLCSHDRHWGALKLLRVLFERTTTLKYIAQNPSEARAFIDFDAMDWKPILSGIEERFGIKAKPETLERINEAVRDLREKFRQEPCTACGMRKQMSWTPRSSQELAKKVGLEHLHFEAFLLPSKFIHPTYFGTRQISRESPTGLRNILKATHTLAVETVLTHQRHFRGSPLASSLAREVAVGFFRVWKYADSDFGLGNLEQ